jgi:folylpolyglutamate synthase
LQLQDLDKLNIIHVAGTKGKGSTCAYVDSILHQHQAARQLPRRIGLFTSPHLVAVRERIRIDSVPLSEELFARYFFQVWDRLEATTPPSPVSTTDAQDQDAFLRLAPPKPIYARYLTLMSWHVFLQEGVDAAVYETGIGGEFDVTNLPEHPLATGITTLGIDHVFVLGDTVAKIAWHKAGIMKPGSPAFSVEQVPEAAAVLEQRAQEKDVALAVVKVDPRLQGVCVRPDAVFQKRNASLAVALAEAALKTIDPDFVADGEVLSKAFQDGLEKVVWRGRCEVKEEGKTIWHVDGAHTVDSLKMAARWFVGECEKRYDAETRLLFLRSWPSHAL